MPNQFRILYYDDGQPFDPRCIERFVRSFSGTYTEVVVEIVKRSASLSEETFTFNVAKLMPSFLMTRTGVFKGVRLKGEKPIDPNGIISKCWEQIGDGLQQVRQFVDQNVRNRCRALAELTPTAGDYINAKTSELFMRLLTQVKARNGEIRRVGASKVLFAALPEIALPVDNSEWDNVFETEDDYGKVMSVMIDEINAWERATGHRHLDDSDPYKPTTLPAVYNVMAMAARPQMIHSLRTLHELKS